MNEALPNGVISYLKNDIILGYNHKEGCDFRKGEFSESITEPLIVPYDDMEMDPSFYPKLSSSYAKEELQSLERMSANPLRSIGYSLKEWNEGVKISDIKSQDNNTSKISSKIEKLKIDGGNEFQYVSEGKKGISKTLSVATTDQLDEEKNVNKLITVEVDIIDKEVAPPVNEIEDVVDIEYNGMLTQNVKNISVNMKTEKQLQNKFVNNVSSYSQIGENEMDVECEKQERGQLESFVSIETQHQGMARQ